MKRVLISNAPPNGNSDTAVLLGFHLEELKKDGDPIAQVSIVSDRQEVEEHMKSGQVDVLFCLSADELDWARKMKAAYKNIKIVVLTALVPDEEVILADKVSALSPTNGNFLKNLIM